MKQNKALKITLTVIAVILALIVLFLLGTFIVDRVMRGSERKLLSEKGYVNPVSVGEYSLNVFVYGSETPSHTIVGMAGMGMDDFACTGRYVTDGVSDDNRVVFIDRAGYGLSDDTTVPQTLDRIISDYRTALKNSGIEPPYILMPHSIAGPYAAYWASVYPDEIEGVFFLDGTQINGKDFQILDDRTLLDKLSVGGSKIGLARLYYAIMGGYLRKFPKEEDVAVSQAMFHCNNAYGDAKYSEEELSAENMEAAWNGTVANDIPKMYICASYGVETVEDVKEMLAYSEKIYGNHNNMSDEDIAKMLDLMIEFRHDNVDVFCEHVGNCEIKLLPGNHIIYCHKPDEVGALLKEFLDSLDAAKQ